MKILQLIHQFLPEFTGGTELYTQQLSHQLIKKGHTIGVFYRRPGNSLVKRVDDVGVEIWAAGYGQMSALQRFRATFGQARLDSHWRKEAVASMRDVLITRPE